MRLSYFILLAISLTILDAQSIDEAGPELDLEYYSHLAINESDLNPDGKDHTYDANLFEGDIAGITLEDLINGTVENRNAINDEYRKWPGGVIPYLYYNGYTESQKALLAEAIVRLQKVTCLRMVPRTDEANYVYILPDGGCYSYIGRWGGQQILSLAPACFRVGIILHEIMHAAGFWHEQARADRDDYIDILWDNIKPGGESQFKKLTLDTITHLETQYDYCSIMHYTSQAFSKNGSPTIVKKEQGGCELVYKDDFSDTDIRKINTLYECNGYPQVNCSDEYSECQEWATTYNLCQSNAAHWMKRYCCASCQQTTVCKDEYHNVYCDSWATSGFCKGTYEAWMSENCKKSCGTC